MKKLLLLVLLALAFLIPPFRTAHTQSARNALEYQSYLAHIAAAAAIPPKPTYQSLVFTHVTVIDMTSGQSKPDQTVVIEGNRIVTISKSSEVAAGSWSAERKSIAERLYKFRLRMVSEMHRAGVPLLAGTNTAYGYPVAGFALHDELSLLVEAGLTPIEALRTATYNPAKYLGMLDSLGTVEKGKIADLVLLEANPLDDIKNARRINAVILDGRYFSKEALTKLLAEAEAAAN